MRGSARYPWPVGGVAVAAALAATGSLVAAFAWTRSPTWFELHTTSLCCITDPRSVKVFAVERLLGLGLGAALVAVAWPAARAVARSTPRAFLAAAGRVAIAVVVALAVCEVALRVVHPVRPPTVISSLPMADHDDRLGWTYRPSQTKNADFPDDHLTVRYDVDALGNRARTATESPDLGAETVLFAGESITAGIGVAWEDTFPAIVSRRFGLQGANLGVHAYGLDQLYLRTLDALDVFRRPVALVMLVLPEELERTTSVDRAHLVLARDGSLVLDRISPLWGHSTLRDLLLRATRYENGDELTLARAILEATVAHASARGVMPLLVMTNFAAPCITDASGESPLEHRLFDGLGAAHIRVDLDPRWMLKDDPHPDARAPHKLADAIETELLALGLRKRGP